MFDADRPITCSEQDRLGRSVFAKYLARCMLDHTSTDSLVIGLEGGAGSGKTSLINLVLEELRSASNNMFDAEKPIILNFSPWSYSGQGQLIYGFFRRLSSEIRRFEYLTNAQQITALLELYVSFFTHEPMPVTIRAKSNWLQCLRGEKDASAWESGRDPTLVKAELNEVLANQKRKIIIIIDNISRLEPGEINQIFQIVKSMGDYANTIYLLSFDKAPVLNALETLHPGESEASLEKLIQLPFAVPPISQLDLEDLLLSKLTNIISLVPEDSWDTHYWADIYYSTLKYFFQDCRDVTRYTNTLSFTYPRVKEVVNPVDFFALTAIEIFIPEVFFGLRENKDLFTDLLDNVYVLDEEQIKKDKARCDEIINRSETIPKDIVIGLLMHLFPRLHSMYTPEELYYHSASLARKNHRLCSPDAFDAYFRSALPSGHIPESEVETILAMANNSDSFDQALTRLNQDDRVLKFLELLDGNVIYRVPKRNVTHVVNALMDSADLFPEGQTTALTFNTPMRVHRIFHQLLRGFTMEERYQILHDAIHQAMKSLYIIVHELIIQSQEHLENEDTYLPLEHRDLMPEQLVQLQMLAVNKIKYWAEHGRLAEHPKLLPILFAWSGWGEETECRRFVREMVKEQRGLLDFLGAALKIPIDQAVTKLEKNPGWRDSLDNVRYFIPIAVIEPLAEAVFTSDEFEKLREREQLALLIFLDLINDKTVKVIPKTS